MSGSMTSRMMRSGSSSSTAEMAWAPLPTARTAKPAKRRLVVSRSRMFGSSSTISTLGPPLMRPVSACCLSVIWELDGGGFVWLLGDANAALAVAGVEDDLVVGIACPFGHATDQIHIGIADDLGVLCREAVERAVGEDCSSIGGIARFVAASHQRVVQVAGPLAEFVPALGGDSCERLPHGLAGSA